MRNDYVIKKVYRSFVLVSILSALTATLGMLIDNVIVGRFMGVDALGAMGVISPVSLVFSAVGNICSGGGTARAAQAIGRGDRRSVSNIFSVTCLFAVAAGMLLTVIGMAFAPQIALLLGAQGSLHQPAVEYLRGFFLGAVPTILTTVLMGFVKIDGSTRLPLLCIVVMTVVNIVLDLAMIFVFKLGMFGMALATTLAYCTAVLTGCIHFARKYCTLSLVRPEKLFKELGAMAATGAPTALSRVCDTVKVMTLNNLLVASAGAGAVAALNVRTQAFNIVGALIMGAASAVMPIAGLFYGGEDKTALLAALKDALRVGLLLSLSAAVVLVVFPSGFASLLGVKEPEVLSMAAMAVRLFAVGMPLQLINTVLMNFYQSTRNTTLASAICLLQSLIYTTGFALVLIRPMGVNGVWTAFLLAEICTLMTTLAVIAVRSRQVPRSIAHLMLLPSDFAVDEKDKLELSIGNSMDEVMLISRNICRFGEVRGLDMQLMKRVSLCIEEIAGNVVKHAFRPGEKRWLDLVLLNRADHLIIRVRDNGVPFDPVAYIQAQEPSTDHVGIRLITGVADQLEYRRSIGLNNVMILFKK